MAKFLLYRTMSSGRAVYRREGDTATLRVSSKLFEGPAPREVEFSASNLADLPAANGKETKKIHKQKLKEIQLRHRAETDKKKAERRKRHEEGRIRNAPLPPPAK